MPDVNGPYDQGYPCWVDLMTPDIDRAAAFYAKIFDWQYQVTGPEFGNYHLAHLDDRSAAGMGPAQNGMPPAWSLYFATDDVDAMTAQAEKLGATVLSAPMEVPGQGRMAVIMDPTGAAFGLWESKGHTGFGVTGVPGTLAWS